MSPLKKAVMQKIFCKLIENGWCVFRSPLCHGSEAMPSLHHHSHHCSPVDPHRLWDATKHHLCDGLQHHLICHLHISDATQEQIYDHGLCLIDGGLQKQRKSLALHFATMPRPQHNWNVQQGFQIFSLMSSWHTMLKSNNRLLMLAFLL